MNENKIPVRKLPEEEYKAYKRKKSKEWYEANRERKKAYIKEWRKRKKLEKELDQQEQQA